MCCMYTVYSGMQEWVIQIPSIPILVSVLFPSLHLKYFRIKFLLLVRLAEGTGATGERIMAEEMSHSFQSNGRFVNRLGRWADKLFCGLERVMKILGPIVSLVNTVVVGDQLYRDIKGGASAAVLAMDGLQLACGILETICLSIDLLMPMLCTFAGPLALVFAAIGLIAGIVSIFLPHPTAADVFVKNELRPWLDKQDDPPYGWKGKN